MPTYNKTESLSINYKKRLIESNNQLHSITTFKSPLIVRFLSFSYFPCVCGFFFYLIFFLNAFLYFEKDGETEREGSNMSWLDDVVLWSASPSGH